MSLNYYSHNYILTIGQNNIMHKETKHVKFYYNL